MVGEDSVGTMASGVDGQEFTALRGVLLLRRESADRQILNAYAAES